MSGPPPGIRKKLLIWFFWLLVYFAAGKLGLQFATVNASTTPFWPPTGIALAAVLMEGFAIWPVILAGAFLVNVTTAGGVLSSAGIAIGNTLEAVLAAYLINQCAGGRRVFRKAQNVFIFTWALSAGALISAFLGVTVLCLARLAPWTAYEAIWTTWWIGDVAGGIIFAPFLLIWFGMPKERHVSPKLAETALFIVACIVSAEIVFGSYSFLSRSNYPIAFLWIPLLFWAGFRFGLRGTTAMTVLLCPVAIWQTLRGFGPFVHGSSNESLLIAQAFAAVLVITSVAVAAVVRERTQMSQNLRSAQKSAERQVEERTADLQESNRTLQKARQDLELLSSRLMRTQDEERRRIARDLHDSSGQLAAALTIELEKLRADEARLTPAGANSLADVMALSAEISREIRTLSYLLHPPLLDEFGLTPAVRWYAEGFAKRSGVAVDLHLDDNVGRLATGTEIAAFRLIQECLTNVHLHSASTLASIHIERQPDGVLKIKVSDNGKGFANDGQTRPGVGISGMRERVKMLGGELVIDSWPREGTTITAAIPAALQDQTPANNT